MYRRYDAGVNNDVDTDSDERESSRIAIFLIAFWEHDLSHCLRGQLLFCHRLSSKYLIGCQPMGNEECVVAAFINWEDIRAKIIDCVASCESKYWYSLRSGAASTNQPYESEFNEL